MNNEITIQSGIEKVNIFAVIASFYSSILEQEVTIAQTKSLVNAQCAFCALVMPLELGFAYRIIALLWFVISVLHCKQRGL